MKLLNLCLWGKVIYPSLIPDDYVAPKSPPQLIYSDLKTGNKYPFAGTYIIQSIALGFKVGNMPLA